MFLQNFTRNLELNFSFVQNVTTGEYAAEARAVEENRNMRWKKISLSSLELSRTS